MVAIIDYGVGNLASIKNILKKVDVEAVVTSDADAIHSATALILPGVGAFDNGIANLQKLGLIDVLHRAVIDRRRPILGICLGMQLFTNGSEEGRLPGLGWFDADTVRFKINAGPSAGVERGLRIPHMGWNEVAPRGDGGVLAGIEAPRFYFLHSYYVVSNHQRDILCTTTYGDQFASGIQKDNIVGVQFHPEKSHKFGMALLRNFARTGC